MRKEQNIIIRTWGVELRGKGERGMRGRKGVEERKGRKEKKSRGVKGKE